MDPRSTTPKSSPTKQKLRRQKKVLHERLRRITSKKITNRNEIPDLIKKLDKYLPPNTASFVKTQLLINQKRGKNGYRWSAKDKMFAMSIFHHSRKVYDILRKLFILPSKATILNTIQKSQIYAGFFNNNIFAALKQKVSTMVQADKQCILTFDEMTIKSGLTYDPCLDNIEGFEDYGIMGKNRFIANHALSFIIRGINRKWKQCIGYFLSSGPVSGDKLHILVKEAIDKLSTIGLSVRGIVCDQGSNNRNFVETHEGVSVSQPFFLHNGSKIYVIYDPPHLPKKMSGIIWKNMVSF